ncbi:unnamed protein product (macronuclear) [Paramecium tetraurelia]|uniref:Uncharacterized protein n=1 Tax=Paramecium tetraurelia TaxID=5888 RepID=A0DAY9_PARTE|nr:uncharacterized protein GSPATT00015113001 [Paramecium tetraurelia]CAK80206.1 unnamed protein product [Paramecium tetraurelia]|eukprot:XP_001447603.1 hypothetical protein (macronuclear) [Paramecium tetraurelia strain d4-2]
MFSDYNTEEQDTCNIEQNLKQKWLPLYQKDTQLAMKILIALKSDIQKQMSSFIQSSIDYMKSLDDQVQELQLKSNQIGSLLYQLPSQVYNNPNQLNLLISESLVDGERIKEFLKIKLRNFVDSDNLINFIQKIQQIKFDDSIRIFNRIFQPQQNQKDGNWTCNQHNERIRYVQLNEEVSNKIACEYCRQDNKYGQYITLQSLKNRWNEYILETAKSFNLVQNKLVSKSNIISQTISSLQLHFQKLIDQINQQLNNQSTIELNKLLNIKNKNNILYQFSNTLENDQFHQQFQLMQYDWSEFSTGQLGDVAYICRQKNQIEQIEQESIYKDIQITNMLNQSKCFTNMMIIQFESFLKYWNKPQINYNQNSEIVESGNQAVPLNYQLLEQYNVKEEKCLSFAFNSDSSILVVGCNCFIKVFEFKQGQLTLRQILNDHKDYVRCLYFMNRTNQFISGCNDCKIMIWSCDSNNLWYCSQVLEGHTDYVRAGVIMNNREDLIISGCDDRSIRFWSKKDSQWHCKQILNGHSAEVRSLSLNPSSTQLISCSTGTEIFLTQYHQNRKQWCIIQIIPTNKCGYSLKFIKDDLFTFQPFDQEILQIYKREQEQQNFQIIQELKVNSKDNRLDFFSQQLIEEKSILLHKNGNTINIIQINQKNNEFSVVQSIQSSDVYLYGSMTRDGKYLVTWDNESRSIRVRKYQQ